MPTRFAYTIDNDPIYALRAMCDKNGLDFTQYYAKLTDLPAAQVQADWSVSDPTSMAFIKNKPDLSVFALSSSLATVATSGSYNDLLDKPTIPAAQVQSDYGQADSSAVDFIKNKPDLSVYARSSDLAEVATTGDYVDLQNKPSIPAAQVQSDWSQSDSSAVDFIKNKPQNLVQDADYVHTDNNYTDVDEAKLAGIEAGAEVNVQADWNQSDSSADDYIKNKPSIPAAQVQSDWSQADSSAVDYIKNKPSIPAPQVQSDWSQSDSNAVDFIKNKPTINNVPAVGSSDDGKVLKASYSGGVGSYSWENESGGSSLPPSTSADEGKVLTVDSNGDPSWRAGDNLVAGAGLNISQSGGTTTISKDETVLFNDAAPSASTTQYVLSESFKNFEYAKFVFRTNDNETLVREIYTPLFSRDIISIVLSSLAGNGNTIYCKNARFSISNDNLTISTTSQAEYTITSSKTVGQYTTKSTAYYFQLVMVVGINRIVSNT